MTLPSNLHIIDDIHDPLSPIGRLTTIHATNGTFAYAADLIVPTTLAGFQFIAESRALHKKHQNFLIAVNSDVSMAAIMEAKNAPQSERDALEDQHTRALKVALPLALQHPERSIFVAFYNETTPNELYRALAYEVNADLYTLHKWGYGTTPDAPKIEGSEYFGITLGFPLPNDKKPLCYDLTPAEGNNNVHVFKLTEPNGRQPAYLSTEGKMLFPVADTSLERHTQAGSTDGLLRNIGEEPKPQP